MTLRTYAITTSVIFLLVAIVHVFRLIGQWDIIINEWHVPAWVSIAGIIVSGFLSWQGFRLFRQGRLASLFS